jgi:hypothetical protein
MPLASARVYNTLSFSATRLLPGSRENANVRRTFFWGQNEHTMDNTPSGKWEAYFWWVMLLAVVCLVVLYMACGGGGEAPVPSPTPTPNDLDMAAPDSMHLTESAFQACRAAFDKAYSLLDGTPLYATQQEIAWSDLKAWAAHAVGLRAVRFEFGLRDSTFVLGLVRLELDSTATPGLFSYQLPDSVYELDGGELVPHDGAVWRMERQYKDDHPDTYFGGVLREDDSGALQPLAHGVDAQAEVMPWELELEPLYMANSKGHPDSTLHAVFTCIARPDSAKVLQHRMAIHLRVRPDQGTGYRDLLDNSYVPGDPFRMHAADFGTSCPPGCGYYVLVPQ